MPCHHYRWHHHAFTFQREAYHRLIVCCLGFEPAGSYWPATHTWFCILGVCLDIFLLQLHLLLHPLMILLERFVVQLHLILHPSSLPWPCAVQLHLLLHPSGRLEQFAVQLATSGVPGWMTSGGVRTSLDQETLGPWLKGIFFNSSPDFARAFRRHQSPDSSMLCCLRQARGFMLAIPKNPITDNTFDPLELVQVLSKNFWDCRTGLSYFAKASLSPTCIVQGPQPRSLWPAPPGGYGWQQPDKIFDSVVAASSLKPGQKNAKPFALHAELGNFGAAESASTLCSIRSTNLKIAAWSHRTSRGPADPLSSHATIWWPWAGLGGR